MKVSRCSPMPFPPIELHGLIGDRRTGALVAADGTMDWLCVPNFDGPPIFGALLDPGCGGFCRFGPRDTRAGKQVYLPESAVLVTAWNDEEEIEVNDAMAWPEDERPAVICHQRVIVRRLRSGTRSLASFELFPRRNFFMRPNTSLPTENGAVFSFVDGNLGFWASFPTQVKFDGRFADLDLEAGEEHWVVLGWNMSPGEWSIERAMEVIEKTRSYWCGWSAALEIQIGGMRAERVKRSILTVQLLSHAQHDSAVAALTTSLPERVGGERNYDYRYAWIRDASLSLALLARMGKVEEVERYLDWLCSLVSTTPAPLQVCYRPDGDPSLDEEEIENVCGYLSSKPVRRGNRAAKQSQLGSFGFFADCVRIYLENKGKWEEKFWQLLERVANYTCERWREKDSGVWELEEEADYVASRVMSWVVLDRAAGIAKLTGRARQGRLWSRTANEIHCEVMDKGWCEEKRSFRQRYESDAIDAAALLIPLMDFLPVDHPRVAGTLQALERDLIVDGLIHRFDPAATFDSEQLPIGEFEGAFLPCVFWHAHALARMGRCEEAEAILARCDAISGATGLFAEEVDAKRGTFLGNIPLLFAHVEYVRAVMALEKAKKQKR